MAAAASSTTPLPPAHEPPALTPPPQPSSSRRLPPPCWSHEETVALIDAYRDKWYSLRRGNLRATHWQEVADDVAARYPLAGGNPPKTSVQCRHKMEKLRKRYRSELQRASNNPHKFSSSWVHFKRMESMEKGPTIVAVDEGDGDEDDDDDDYQDLYQKKDVKHGVARNRNNQYASISNGIGSGSGFRIRIPNRSSFVPPVAKIHRNFNENPNPNTNSNYGAKRVSSDCNSDRLGKKKERTSSDPIAEMVSAIKLLGDGFVRMERMKMEMAREVEEMRMEMELKRTEMILESQQWIVDAFASAFSEKRNKKAKRNSSSES